MTSQLLNRPGFSPKSALSVLHHLEDLPENEAARAWREILCKERDLPEPEQRSRSLQRIHAWLAMDEVDPILTSAFERALETFPIHEAEAIVERERDAALNGLAYRDYVRLARILHWLDLPPVERQRGADFAKDVIPLAVNLVAGRVPAA